MDCSSKDFPCRFKVVSNGWWTNYCNTMIFQDLFHSPSPAPPPPSSMLGTSSKFPNRYAPNIELGATGGRADNEKV